MLPLSQALQLAGTRLLPRLGYRGLMVRGCLHESSSLGSPGLEKVKWLTPVYPGDTLTLRQRFLETRPMKSRPDVGLARSLWEMFNQHGEQVLSMDGWGMFRRRTPGAD